MLSKAAKKALQEVSDFIGNPGIGVRVVKDQNGSRLYQVIERPPENPTVYHVWGMSYRGWTDVVNVVKARWSPMYENCQDYV